MRNPTERTIAIEIRENGTEKVIERFDVSERGGSYIDRLFDGLVQKVDFERFYVHEVKEERK